ncbi:hypothetical protein Tco_0573886 [Tanacetum coccineum]
MGDEHLSTIPEIESDKLIKSSLENLVQIPSESKGISDDICDVPSPKIDFLPEEFAGELDLIDPILPGIDEDDFDEEEGAIDIDILQIEDEILQEVDTFLVSEDSIPPGIESDFDSEGDIIFLDDLLNDDPIPEYERFTFDIEPDAPVINNFDELNEDECFDPGGGEIVFPQMLKMTIPSHFSFGLFSRFSPTLRILLYFSPPGVKTPFLTPASPLRTGGISSGWNFHVL